MALASSKRPFSGPPRPFGRRNDLSDSASCLHSREQRVRSKASNLALVADGCAEE